MQADNANEEPMRSDRNYETIYVSEFRERIKCQRLEHRLEIQRMEEKMKQELDRQMRQQRERL